jgi:hypothetical protein
MLRQLDPGSRPIIAFSRQVIAINSLWLLIWSRWWRTARFPIQAGNDGVAVIPGASKTRTRNLEIPGSMLRIAPE